MTHYLRTMTITLSIAMFLLFVGRPAPAQAECDSLSEYAKKFDAEKSDLGTKLKRFDAKYSSPHKDAVTCRALLRVERDSILVVISADVECFESEQQQSHFKETVTGIGKNAAIVSASYCTPEERRAIMSSEAFSK